MQTKKKPCKGHGKAIGFGCCEPCYPKMYGLCYKCYKDWLYNSEQGKEIIKKSIIKAKKNISISYKRERSEQKKALKKTSKKDVFYQSSAWKYCSKYVLLFYSDSEGYVECSTSGLRYQLPNKNIQAGHYFKATDHAGTAFDFKNLAPQSYRDNFYYSGKPEVMKEWLIKTHGQDIIEYLTRSKNEAYKLDDTEFEKWKEHYKKLFNELVKKKGFNPWKK